MRVKNDGCSEYVSDIKANTVFDFQPYAESYKQENSTQDVKRINIRRIHIRDFYRTFAFDIPCHRSIVVNHSIS